MTQQYSLRWNNHQPNFISMFTTLLNTKTLVDVTLAAEGQHLQAHKVVLSACSTYFQVNIPGYKLNFQIYVTYYFLTNKCYIVHNIPYEIQ